MIVDRHYVAPTLGDEVGPYETVRVVANAAGARDAPPQAWKSDNFV
ncbi:MAG TPA: hypothetical protein VJP02_32075 [Candidatus Sulfotelmatobacter sp.]|nr:hypothetical protein [Candidatus Sulfotelmatobacter sp.]